MLSTRDLLGVYWYELQLERSDVLHPKSAHTMSMMIRQYHNPASTAASHATLKCFLAPGSRRLNNANGVGHNAYIKKSVQQYAHIQYHSVIVTLVKREKNNYINSSGTRQYQATPA